jgi:hypothetical protein
MARLLSFFPDAQLIACSHAVAWDMKARPNSPGTFLISIRWGSIP